MRIAKTRILVASITEKATTMNIMRTGTFRLFPKQTRDGFWFLFSVRYCFFRHDSSFEEKWPNRTVAIYRVAVLTFLLVTKTFGRFRLERGDGASNNGSKQVRPVTSLHHIAVERLRFVCVEPYEELPMNPLRLHFRVHNMRGPAVASLIQQLRRTRTLRSLIVATAGCELVSLFQAVLILKLQLLTSGGAQGRN